MWVGLWFLGGKALNFKLFWYRGVLTINVMANNNIAIYSAVYSNGLTWACFIVLVEGHCGILGINFTSTSCPVCRNQWGKVMFYYSIITTWLTAAYWLCVFTAWPVLTTLIDWYLHLFERFNRHDIEWLPGVASVQAQWPGLKTCMRTGYRGATWHITASPAVVIASYPDMWQLQDFVFTSHMPYNFLTFLSFIPYVSIFWK